MTGYISLTWLLGQQVHRAEWILWILPILRILRMVGVMGTCVGVTGRTCAGESRDNRGESMEEDDMVMSIGNSLSTGEERDEPMGEEGLQAQGIL